MSAFHFLICVHENKGEISSVLWLELIASRQPFCNWSRECERNKNDKRCLTIFVDYSTGWCVVVVVLFSTTSNECCVHFKRTDPKSKWTDEHFTMTVYTMSRCYVAQFFFSSSFFLLFLSNHSNVNWVSRTWNHRTVNISYICIYLRYWNGLFFSFSTRLVTENVN